MEMDRTRLQNAADIHSKSSHALNPWWQEGETKGDVEEKSRAGDEGWSWGQVTKLAMEGNIGVLWCRPYL